MPDKSTVISPEDVILHQDALVEEASRRPDAFHIGKRAVQGALIGVQVLPTNGAITYGVPALVYGATGDALLTMGAAGALTGGLEGLSSLAAADILSNSPDSWVVDRVNRLVKSRTIRSLLAMGPDGNRINPIAESLIAIYGGTPAAMVARESESGSSERTHSERRKYGLRTAATLGVLCTAQMGLYTQVFEGLTEANPMVATASGGVLAAGAYGANKLRNKVKEKKLEQDSVPRYDLEKEEVGYLESDLVEDVIKKTNKGLRRFGPKGRQKRGVYPVWIDPYNKYANFVRAKEAEYFPEVSEIDPEDEAGTVFLAMVDTREGSERVVHATTISYMKEKAEVISSGSTGFNTIDSLIELENFSAEEFLQYYESHGVDVGRSISVDTNFRVGDKAELVDGLKTSDLAYLTMFNEVDRLKEGAEGRNAVFASINQDSIDSFDRIGLEYEPLMGRRDLKIPEKEGYMPVFIPYNEHNMSLFQSMDYSLEDLRLTG